MLWDTLDQIFLMSLRTGVKHLSPKGTLSVCATADLPHPDFQSKVTPWQFKNQHEMKIQWGHLKMLGIWWQFPEECTARAAVPKRVSTSRVRSTQKQSCLPRCPVYTAKMPKPASQEPPQWDLASCKGEYYVSSPVAKPSATFKPLSNQKLWNTLETRLDWENMTSIQYNIIQYQ